MICLICRKPIENEAPLLALGQCYHTKCFQEAMKNNEIRQNEQWKSIGKVLKSIDYRSLRTKEDWDKLAEIKRKDIRDCESMIKDLDSKLQRLNQELEDLIADKSFWLNGGAKDGRTDEGADSKKTPND